MSRAEPGEMTFVLLARDIAAPGAIREWCRLRCLHGKNQPNDPQITGALKCADIMDGDRLHRLLMEQVDATGKVVPLPPYGGSAPPGLTHARCAHKVLLGSPCEECDEAVARSVQRIMVRPQSEPSIRCRYCGHEDPFYVGMEIPKHCVRCRDRFAAAALPVFSSSMRSEDVARLCYVVADALLNERVKTTLSAAAETWI